jgi:hypothetical protein
MNAKTALTAASLAGSLAVALALASAAKAGPAPMQPGADKCYGIALAGKNDCAAGGRLRPPPLEIRRQGQLRKHDDAEGPRHAEGDVIHVRRRRFARPRLKKAGPFFVRDGELRQRRRAIGSSLDAGGLTSRRIFAARF